MEMPRYITIEGPIGVGKTTLAKKLAEDLKGQLVLEEPDDNPFLADFYRDRAKHALKTQVLFLINRYLQQKDLTQRDLFQQTIVCDYLFSKDRIFASMNLSKEEFFLYEKIYSLFDTQIPKPEIVVYLQASLALLKKHIKKRGIPFEKYITEDYLVELTDSYNRFFFSYNETPLLVVNVTDLDFVQNRQDYENLVKEILSLKSKRGMKHYLSIGK